MKKPLTAPKSPNPRQRGITACQQTVEVHDRVRRAAERVAHDIDELTMPGVPIEIDEEDSLVLSIESMIQQRSSEGG